jgi:hypothetical protein
MSKSVAVQRFLSETTDESQDYVVTEYEDGHLQRSVQVKTYQEAMSLKEQWDRAATL